MKIVWKKAHDYLNYRSVQKKNYYELNNFKLFVIFLPINSKWYKDDWLV